MAYTYRPSFSICPPLSSPQETPNTSLNHPVEPQRQYVAEHTSNMRLLMPALPPNQQPLSPTPTLNRKRAPKAPTMTAESWKPLEPRIRQLFADQGVSYKKLRAVVNEEFGLSATERQYKAQIRRMNLERNSKADERYQVVKHIRYRESVGKRSHQVHVRGHDASKKLARWMREAGIEMEIMFTNGPPSPLPSCARIYTKSRQGTPESELYHNLNGDSRNRDSVTYQILKYAGEPRTLKSDEIRKMFDNLQILLDKDSVDQNSVSEHWQNMFEEITGDVTYLRNLMISNRAGVEIVTSSGLSEQPEFRPQSCKTPTTYHQRRRLRHKHATWMTHYGLVQISCWQNYSDYDQEASVDTPSKTLDNWEERSGGSIAIMPGGKKPSFRVVAEFATYPSPINRITYHPVISSDSKIFKIVIEGDVETLMKELNDHKISLNVRDEKGRSLLRYATHHNQLRMCRVLLDNNADVNSIEYTLDEERDVSGPMYAGGTFDNPAAHAECTKLLYEAGLDGSLEFRNSERYFNHAFNSNVASLPVEHLKSILNVGGHFLAPLIQARIGPRESVDPPLILMAVLCGGLRSVDIVDKALLLLSWKADIASRTRSGNTVLHEILKEDRLSDSWPLRWAEDDCCVRDWCLSFTEPRNLLVAYIAAGADVYARNDRNETPSMIAEEHGRLDAWQNSLKFCGYNPDSVLNNPDERCQTSILTLEEFSRKWQKTKQIRERRICEFMDHDDEYMISIMEDCITYGSRSYRKRRSKSLGSDWCFGYEQGVRLHSSHSSCECYHDNTKNSGGESSTKTITSIHDDEMEAETSGTESATRSLDTSQAFENGSMNTKAVVYPSLDAFDKDATDFMVGVNNTFGNLAPNEVLLDGSMDLGIDDIDVSLRGSTGIDHIVGSHLDDYSAPTGASSDLPWNPCTQLLNSNFSHFDIPAYTNTQAVIFNSANGPNTGMDYLSMDLFPGGDSVLNRYDTASFSQLETMGCRKIPDKVPDTAHIFGNLPGAGIQDSSRGLVPGVDLVPESLNLPFDNPTVNLMMGNSNAQGGHLTSVPNHLSKDVGDYYLSAESVSGRSFLHENRAVLLNDANFCQPNHITTHNGTISNYGTLASNPRIASKYPPTESFHRVDPLLVGFNSSDFNPVANNSSVQEGSHSDFATLTQPQGMVINHSSTEFHPRTDFFSNPFNDTNIFQQPHSNSQTGFIDISDALGALESGKENNLREDDLFPEKEVIGMDFMNGYQFWMSDE